MKKIVMGIAAIACAASMFAVDISSTVKMNADIVRKSKSGDNVEFFAVNNKDQKDSDALIFSANGEKAGGQFQLWYRFDGTDGLNFYKDQTKKEAGTNDKDKPWEDGNLDTPHGLRIRGVNLWFKPIDMIKVTVGNVSVDSYKEMIFWWHGVYGEKPGSWGNFGGEYISGVGVKTEIAPIDGLNITFAFMPGIDTAWISTAEGSKVTNFALKASYSNIADLPLSATVVYADKNQNKVIGIGADYGNKFGAGLYAFANINIAFDKDFKFTALSVDNYEKYVVDALKVEAHLPVSIYKNGDKVGVGMHASVKASYTIDAFTPYLVVTNEPDGDAGWVFDDNFADNFKITTNVGTTFGVGSANFDAYLRLDFAKDTVNWKVPVDITVSL